MKTFIKFLVPVAVAAAALASCQNEKEVTPVEKGRVHISVKASTQDLANTDTKTYIGTYDDHANSIIWGTGEYMKLALTGASTVFANSTDTFADDNEGKIEALFEFDVDPGEASTYKYMGVYPASAAVAESNETPATYKVNLKASQDATASSYDPAAYIMVAKPETFNDLQEVWEASFRRATALNKVTLTNLPAGVVSVEFTAFKSNTNDPDIYLTGARTIDLTTGESGDIYNGSNKVIINYATPLSAGSNTIWFTSWGTDIPAGAKLLVVAKTASKAYTRELTAKEGGIHFKEGYLNTLSVNMASATAGPLDGTYLVLARKGSSSPYTYYALKGVASGTRVASVDYTGELTSFTGDPALVWTIEANGASYTLKNKGNYLGWTSDNSASLIPEADFDEDKCLMSFSEWTTNGSTYKINNTKTSGRILARNTSNEYFAFYTSTSQYCEIVLVPATAISAVANPSFDPAAGEVSSGTVVNISTTTPDATIYYTTGNTEFSTSGWTQGNSVTISAPTTIKAIAIKEGMADSDVVTASYTIAGGITLTANDITMGSNTVQGTENNLFAYRLGTGSNDGSLTFKAGYSSITFRLEAYSNTPRTFSVTNGKINNSNSLVPSAGSPSGTIDSGFTRTDTGTEYTIVVDDPTKVVVFSGRRGIAWGFTVIEAAPSHVVTLSSLNNGQVTMSIGGNEIESGHKVQEGQSITLSANPADGYRFASWNVYKTGDNTTTVTVSNNAFTMPEYDVTVEATFTEIPSHVVTLGAHENGGVTIKVGEETINSGDSVKEEKTVTLTPTSSEGYRFASWSVHKTGDNTTTVTVTNNAFTMPEYDVTVEATFTEIPSHVVTLGAHENGGVTIKVGEETINSGDSVKEEKIVTLSASPADGFTFASWSVHQTGDVTAIVPVNENKFTMPDFDVTVNATFTSGPSSLSAPENVSITDIDIAGKKFSGSWNAVSNATSYDWVVSTAENANSITENNTRASGNTTNTSFTTAALDDSHKPASGQVYYLYVMAKGDGTVYAEDNDYSNPGHAILYQHIFTAKPSTGDNITLSSINWSISATNLGSYNSGNYAGIQLGTSGSNGSISLTSSSSWGGQNSTNYTNYTTVKKVNVWANLGGTSCTPSVTIGGKSASGSGTVVKNSSAGSDYSKASKVVFTPDSEGTTGIVVVSVSTVKAGYLCAIEVLSE